MVEYRKSSHAILDVKYHVVVDHEVSLQGFARRGRGTDAGFAAADMRRAGSGDRAWVCKPGPCAYAGRLLQDEFPQLKKRYWRQHLWAREYFCASVGAVDEETIRKCIESQQWEDPGENFKISEP
jgi:putative transposase